MKTIFITGASAGLGKAAAKLFAANGWKVIATMRTPEKEQELTTIPNIILLPLDVTNLQQIKDAVAKATASGKVDVVFNNAGYGLMGPLESYTDEQIQRQLNTNLLGVISVIKEFIPHFRAMNGGLFITTTSIGGRVAVPFSPIYHATKWALEGFSESLAFELKPFGIGVKTVAPGGIISDFGSRSMDIGQHAAYDAAFNKMMGVLTGPSIFEFSTAEAIAQVVYEAVTDGRDQLRYTAGPDADRLYTKRLKEGDESFRKWVAAQLLD